MCTDFRENVPGTYMNFAPGSQYIPSGIQGSYISSLKSIADFFEIYILLVKSEGKDKDLPNQMTHDEQTIQFLILALVFDFMAWSAVELRVRLPKPSSHQERHEVRKEFAMEINIIVHNHEHNVGSFGFLQIGRAHV